MAKMRENARPMVKTVVAQPPLQKVAPAAPKPMKVDFEVWWAMTSKMIPTQHYKEIVMADFRARGLGMKETTATYNEALKKYGVKLKS